MPFILARTRRLRRGGSQKDSQKHSERSEHQPRRGHPLSLVPDQRESKSHSMLPGSLIRMNGQMLERGKRNNLLTNQLDTVCKVHSILRDHFLPLTQSDLTEVDLRRERQRSI